MSLYCLMEICFLLLQSDVQGLYVLTQSNAVCSCGYDVNVLLINGRFIFLFFFKSLSTAAICREKQYPSSQHPSTVCHILPCTRRWQPCPYLRTAQITIPSPICPLSYIIKDQAGISLQSGSFHRVGGLCITAAWVIKQMSVVVSLYASQVSDCQKVPQVSA